MSKKIVIKIGGSTSNDYKKIIREIANITNSGNQIIIVHGGGNLISGWLNDMNKKTEFINGLRVTDNQTLSIVIGALAGTTNKNIVANFAKHQIDAIGLSGVDGNLLFAEKINEPIGNVGEIKKVNKKIIEILIKNNYLPVISPVALSVNDKGSILNVNADTAAIAIAIAINADKCILLSDVDGVKDSNGTIINNLSSQKAKELIEKKIIIEGMIPKVTSALKAAELGISCHIANGNHIGILDDILMNKDKGTRID
ncbi:MAG: acetylglutamate kinase [Dehalococcoidia bacterium]|nr:acetylglutamate kinase [Dehalococcoidia bacterium]